jgi:hypothetical protein
MESAHNAEKQSKIISGLAVLCVLYLVTCWFSMTECHYGSDVIYLLYLGLSLLIGLFALATLLLVLGIPIGFISILLRMKDGTWADIKELAKLDAVLICLLALTFGIKDCIQNWGLRSLTIRSEPLIEAIQQYQNANKMPPQSLADLVPKYLSKTPTTDVAAYPKFDYVRNQNPVRFASNPWILVVPISTDKLSCGYLVYYPNQHYPESGHGNKEVKKFGNWVRIESDISEARVSGFAFTDDSQ